MYNTGGRAVHSYGRLIPHEFPITDLQQISGPDGIGRITCTVSSGTARFYRPGGVLETNGVTQQRHGATGTLVVNQSDSFRNRHVYCSDARTNYFYLFISATSEFDTIVNIEVHNSNQLPIQQLNMADNDSESAKQYRDLSEHSVHIPVSTLDFTTTYMYVYAN